jgi:hypothetical protein
MWFFFFLLLGYWNCGGSLLQVMFECQIVCLKLWIEGENETGSFLVGWCNSLLGVYTRAKDVVGLVG